MKLGTLTYDFEQSRFDIGYDEGGQYGGLHCGDTFEIFIKGQWVPTRIEYDNNGWYLVDVNYDDWHTGQRIRK